MVSPAAGPRSVHMIATLDTISWTSADGVKWEAYPEEEHDAYGVCAPNGEYGEDEEDYALVSASDLLNVIANGLGDGVTR